MMRTELTGQNALRVFLKGKDFWNRLIEEKGVTKVDFEGVTFATALNSETLDFRGFEFPEVTFSTQNFDQLTEIDFSEAVFRGNAHFTEVTFPVAQLLFIGARFEQDAIFERARFQGDANFSGAVIKLLGDFSASKWLRGGRVLFKDATVNSLIFEDSEGQANISFDFRFRKPIELIDFARSTFDDIYICGSTPKVIGRLGFESVKVNEFCGLVNIRADYINIRNCDFGGNCLLISLSTQTLDCAGSKFERQAEFRNIGVEAYIGFNGCSFAHPVTIDDIRIGDPIGRCIFGTRITPSQFLSCIKKRFFKADAEPHENLYLGNVVEYARSYRRLKQLAAESNNHSLELDMFALELKATRWLKAEWWARIPYDLYALFSDYGRSLLRPFVGLFTFWILFSLVYMECATSSSRSDFLGQWSAGLLLSLAQSVPFLTWHRTAKSEALGVLYPAAGGIDVPWLVHLAAVSQSILAVIFIFLLGLGIRNRFRI